jgi:hypothetical protein
MSGSAAGGWKTQATEQYLAERGKSPSVQLKAPRGWSGRAAIGWKMWVAEKHQLAESCGTFILHSKISKQTLRCWLENAYSNATDKSPNSQVGVILL